MSKLLPPYCLLTIFEQLLLDQPYYKVLSGHLQAASPLAPSRYQPGRLVPPGEALWAAVEETNTRHFFVLYGWLGFYD